MALSWALLGPSWALLCDFWPHFLSFWSTLAPKCAYTEMYENTRKTMVWEVLGSLGSLLGVSWSSLGALLGLSWTSWGSLGALLDPSGAQRTPKVCPKAFKVTPGSSQSRPREPSSAPPGHLGHHRAAPDSQNDQKWSPRASNTTDFSKM